MPSHEHGSANYNTANLATSHYCALRTSEFGPLSERLERQLVLDRIGSVSGRNVLEAHRRASVCSQAHDNRGIAEA